MLIVGCDYHPRWQQVAWLDPETGETGEQKLVNGNGEAERWYGQLPVPSLIGLESTGNSQWFIEMLQRPAQARVRVLEDLICHARQVIGIEYDRMRRSAAEGEPLRQTYLELLEARKADCHTESDHGRLTHGGELSDFGHC